MRVVLVERPTAGWADEGPAMCSSTNPWGWTASPVRLAEGLLADRETRVIYGQPPSELEQARELLGLSDTQLRLLPLLPRGEALWKVGNRSFLVEHRLSPIESSLVDTDGRMRSPNSEAPGARAVASW